MTATIWCGKLYDTEVSTLLYASKPTPQYCSAGYAGLKRYWYWRARNGTIFSTGEWVNEGGLIGRLLMGRPKHSVTFQRAYSGDVDAVARAAIDMGCDPYEAARRLGVVLEAA